jgi:hypothetical protein
MFPSPHSKRGQITDAAAITEGGAERVMSLPGCVVRLGFGVAGTT